MKNLIALIYTICWFASSVSAQKKITDERLSPVLNIFLQSKKPDQTLNLIVTFKNDQFKNPLYLKAVKFYKEINTIQLTISQSQLEILLKDSNILFIDKIRIPVEELTTGAVDYTINKINYVHGKWPTINGNNINISVKEQKPDTADIDFKGRYFNSGVSAQNITSHATIMSTIIAGAGNSSSMAKGVAWGANLTSSSFFNLMPDEDIVFKKYNISVQNHSYGTGIENYYGADAAAYDVSVYKNPTVVHVFSAGNSGTGKSTSGLYKDVTGYANLTGSFKMAKNIITVGHVDSFYKVLPASSKGPGFDGRMKPELVAFGDDGSSGATAIVSGTIAVLQQAYQQKFGVLPNASLIKAILFNSADDVHQKGIDYHSGFGNLNAKNAVKTIEESRIIENSVMNNEVKTFIIPVKPNTSALKVTISWTDTAAKINAEKALVNDIDTRIISPAGQYFLPWVLSHYPLKDSLEKSAERKVDTLNNTEQITIENPESGNYLIEVKGSIIKTGHQSFAIAYQTDTTNFFEWTYPTAFNVLKGGKENVIKWQTNRQGNAKIDYSLDGFTWLPVTNTALLEKQYFKWDLPLNISKALLRIEPLNESIYFTSDTFFIANETAINVGFNCEDSVLFYWNDKGATSYIFYALGLKYMEPIANITDTFKVLSKSQFPSFHYSVQPLYDNKKGIRSYGYDYRNSGVGCYFKTFFAYLQNASALIDVEIGSLYQIASIEIQKFDNGSVSTIHSFNIAGNTKLKFVDTNLAKGINKYRIAIKLKNGNVIYSHTEHVYYFPAQPVIILSNPTQQNKPIKIIAKEPGMFAVEVFEVTGRIVYKQPLLDINNTFPAFSLPKGLYFVKVIPEDGKYFIQKLVVY